MSEDAPPSTSPSFGSDMTEARSVLLRATIAAGVLLSVKFGLYTLTRSLCIGADTLVTLVVTAALAALLLNLREPGVGGVRRPAVLASSLAAWGVLLGGLLAVVRVVERFAFDPPDAANVAEAAKEAEASGATAVVVTWVRYGAWGFWLEIFVALAGVALVVYLVRSRGLLPGRGLGNAVTLAAVAAAASAGAALGLGVLLAMPGRWVDPLFGLIVAGSGLAVLWVQVWRDFNRFVHVSETR